MRIRRETELTTRGRRLRRLGTGAVGFAVAATSLLTVGVVASSPASAVTSGNCTSTAGLVTCTFGFTGVSDSFTVPVGVTSLHVVATGAPGGAMQRFDSSLVTPGGRGATVTADLGVTPGQELTITVGGKPTHDPEGCVHAVSPNQCSAGFNGGGRGQTNYFIPEADRVYGGGAGSGGATDVRAAPFDLSSRLLVAGGGGGAGIESCGPGGAGGDAGFAGGASPVAVCEDTSVSAAGGAPGTQSSGGAGVNAGALGRGGDSYFRNSGGAGGGGLFGGGAPTTSARTTGIGGGGGGSNLVPSGGSVALDDAGNPGVVLTYAGPLPAPEPAPCTTAGSAVTCTYPFTSSTRALTVPPGVASVQVVASGAPGGNGGGDIFEDSQLTAPGGRGALVTADLAVSPGQVLLVTVGGTATGEGCGNGAICTPGYNGGGAVGVEDAFVLRAAAGGGASDIRVGGTGLTHRVLVAAGGGGAGTSSMTADGPGGDADHDGATPLGDTIHGNGGKAGTQSAGGAGGWFCECPTTSIGLSGVLGVGGYGATGGGGGGGGLFGGGGASGIGYGVSNASSGGGGGGGSSLVPAGGTLGLDDSRTPRIVISYTLPPAPVGASIVGTPPAATSGQLYSFQYALDGTPVVSLTDGVLPPGLFLNVGGVAGLLSGSPGAAGSYTFTLTASNGVGFGVGDVDGDDLGDGASCSDPGLGGAGCGFGSGVVGSAVVERRDSVVGVHGDGDAAAGFRAQPGVGDGPGVDDLDDAVGSDRRGDICGRGDGVEQRRFEPAGDDLGHADGAGDGRSDDLGNCAVDGGCRSGVLVHLYDDGNTHAVGVVGVRGVAGGVDVVDARSVVGYPDDGRSLHVHGAGIDRCRWSGGVRSAVDHGDRSCCGERGDQWWQRPVGHSYAAVRDTVVGDRERRQRQPGPGGVGHLRRHVGQRHVWFEPIDHGGVERRWGRDGVAVDGGPDGRCGDGQGECDGDPGDLGELLRDGGVGRGGSGRSEGQRRGAGVDHPGWLRDGDGHGDQQRPEHGGGGRDRTAAR